MRKSKSVRPSCLPDLAVINHFTWFTLLTRVTQALALLKLVRCRSIVATLSPELRMIQNIKADNNSQTDLLAIQSRESSVQELPELRDALKTAGAVTLTER